MDRLVDLHTHSVYSDGCNTPLELLNMAKDNNLKYFAITDHDEIAGSKELVSMDTGNVICYSGVEMTAKVSKGRMHILGYNIKLNDSTLNRVLKSQKEASIYNILLYIEILKKEFNLVIPKNEIDTIINSVGNIGRPQLALLLVKLGYANDVEDAFKKYLIWAYEKVRKVKKGLVPEEVIELINGASGVAFLAHPNSLLLTLEELRSEVIYLKSVGLKGLETIHYKLSSQERKAYHELAMSLDLLESGGTDYHGVLVKPDVELARGKNGNVLIKENTLSLTKCIKSRYTRD